MSTSSSKPVELLPLSILIITHRSDHRFMKSLASTQFAQEVLIVDTASGNDWEKLAKKYRFKVVRYQKSMEDFSQIRNWLINQANQSWIFFLDSDEVISPKLIKQIPKLLQNNIMAGFEIRRQDIFLDKTLHHGEPGEVYKLRLAQKKRIKFVRPVHEKAEVLGMTQKVSAPIIHYAHESISEFWSKISIYAKMDAEYRFDNGERFQLIQLLVLPVGKFGYNFFYKLGFLDGYRGFLYAFMMSMHSVLVRILLYELEITSPKK